MRKRRNDREEHHVNSSSTRNLDERKKVLISKNQLPDEIRFDTPGFISDQFYALDPKRFYIRTIFMPESFFVYLERGLIGLLGKRGELELYKIGKKYGYRLAMFNKFPKGNLSILALLAIYQFFEIAYAKKISTPVLDPTEKTMQLLAEDLEVVDKGSTGYLDPVGCWSGIWCYLNGDYSLESYMINSSKNKYLILCGPRKMLRKQAPGFIMCDELPKKVDFGKYMKNNRPQETSSESIVSFNKLFKDGLIYYKPGKVLMKGCDERIVPSEISKVFEIEAALDEELVYGSSYRPFYMIGSSEKKNADIIKFLCNLLTGFGFGRVSSAELSDSFEINFRGYPWFTEDSEKTSFAYIKGAVIGILDGGTGKKYGVSSVSGQMVDSVFTVTLDVKGG